MSEYKVTPSHYSRIRDVFVDGSSSFEKLLNCISNAELTGAAKWLPKCKDGLNACNEFGRTSLSMALSCLPQHRLRVIQWMLDHGADPNMMPSFKVVLAQRESILWGVLDEPAVLDLLLVAGASVEVANRQGQRPLHQAALINNAAATARLLAAGAGPNELTNHLETPLHLTEDAEVTRLLIEAGAELELKDRFLRTPLIRACQSGRTGKVLALLQAGADPTAATPNGLDGAGWARQNHQRSTAAAFDAFRASQKARAVIDQPIQAPGLRPL